MKFVDLIIISVVMSISASFYAIEISALRKVYLSIEKVQKECDSLEFISKSFCNCCNKKGFRSLEKWKETCEALWNLDEISWKKTHSINGIECFKGCWAGPYGRGEVWCTNNQFKKEVFADK